MMAATPSFLLVSFMREGCHLGCDGGTETYAVPWTKKTSGFVIYGTLELYKNTEYAGGLPGMLSDLQRYLPVENLPIEDGLQQFMTERGALSLNCDDMHSDMRPQALGDVAGMVTIKTLW
jgi:hypothetical protein